jgi:recombination protein RecA
MSQAVHSLGATPHEEVPRVDREKMLDLALQQIEKQHGKGAVMRLGEHAGANGVGVIPTGSLALDVALGIGGIPRGRIVEVYGPEGSGKTTVCLHVIAEAQAKGGITAFIDAEHALDPTYAHALGVNIDELLVSQPDSGEQALEIADLLVRSGAVDLVVIDSVAALVPRAEIEGEMGDSHVGLQARLMSQAMRKLAGSLSRFDTTAIFINQLREKIGIMFGNPETTPTHRCGSTCARSTTSRTAPRWSARACAPRCRRTSWPRRSVRRSSTSCTERASPRRARSSTSGSTSTW